MCLCWAGLGAGRCVVPGTRPPGSTAPLPRLPYTPADTRSLGAGDRETTHEQAAASRVSVNRDAAASAPPQTWAVGQSVLGRDTGARAFL